MFGSLGDKIIAAFESFFKGSYYVSTICPNCTKFVRVRIPAGQSIKKATDICCPRCKVQLKPK